MSFDLSLNIMRLYNGRRSFYASIRIGRRFHYFVSRWDTVRVTPAPHRFDLWRGPVMTWYAGRIGQVQP